MDDIYLDAHRSHDVPYIEPQRVQDSTWVRVMIAKDAISTGWDCPRAEVMISFRAANDRTVLGLVAEIERDFISARTKEALAKRKAEGVKLGRPAEPAKTMRLDKYADKIEDYLAKKIDKRAIAKLLDVSPNTLYAWQKARRPDVVGPTPLTDPIRS